MVRQVVWQWDLPRTPPPLSRGRTSCRGRARGPQFKVTGWKSGLPYLRTGDTLGETVLMVDFFFTVSTLLGNICLGLSGAHFVCISFPFDCMRWLYLNSSHYTRRMQAVP